MDWTILLVEDEENDVIFLQSAFKKAGVTHPLQVVSTGQAALEYLRGTNEFSDREAFPVPCLVLLDLKLPYVMGLDVLRALRMETESTVPVIVLTSSNVQEDIDAAFRAGANAYLVKPNDSIELVAMARAIRDFWLVHNHFPVPGESIVA